MLGVDLHRLVAVSGLVSADVTDGATTLEQQGGSLSATYYGSFVRGTSVISYSGDPLPTLQVGSNQLLEISSLFAADQEVSLSLAAASNNLILKAAGQQAAIRKIEDVPATVVTCPPGGITLDRDSLATEIGLASGFTAANPHIPVLEGVRLMAKGGLFLLMAYDGRAGVYRSTLTAVLETPLLPDGDAFDATVPAKDLKAAIGVLQGNNVIVQVQRGTDGNPSRVILAGDSAVVHISVISGVWPDVSPLTKQVARSTIVLPSDRLQAVLKGAATLGAGQVIFIERQGDGIRLRTKASDLGVFSLSLDAQSGLDGWPDRITLDLQCVKLATSLGRSITFQIGAEDLSVVLVLGEGTRKYWFQQRVAQE